jgi:hypothetical protein
LTTEYVPDPFLAIVFFLRKNPPKRVTEHSGARG